MKEVLCKVKELLHDFYILNRRYYFIPLIVINIIYLLLGYDLLSEAVNNIKLSYLDDIALIVASAIWIVLNETNLLEDYHLNKKMKEDITSRHNNKVYTNIKEQTDKRSDYKDVVKNRLRKEIKVEKEPISEEVPDNIEIENIEELETPKHNSESNNPMNYDEMDKDEEDEGYEDEDEEDDAQLYKNINTTSVLSEVNRLINMTKTETTHTSLKDLTFSINKIYDI